MLALYQWLINSSYLTDNQWAIVFMKPNHLYFNKLTLKMSILFRKFRDHSYNKASCYKMIDSFSQASLLRFNSKVYVSQ